MEKTNSNQNKLQNSYKSNYITVAYANIDYLQKDTVWQDCMLMTKSGNRINLTADDYKQISSQYYIWCAYRISKENKERKSNNEQYRI